MTKPLESQSKDFSPSPNNMPKTIFFWVITICLPIIIIGLLELVLALLDYNEKDRLIQEGKVNGHDILTLNPKVTRRYFSQKDIKPAVRTSEYFFKEKSPDTYRIFCLGGSTVLGFPYPSNCTFSHFLKERLNNLLPLKRIEVINMGVTAINSYTIREFVSELVKYQPDLFIIYMGHNEFYGALGVASTEFVGLNPRWVRLYLDMQKFRVFRALQDLVRWTKEKIKDVLHKKPPDGNFMERMVHKKQIPLNSREYEIAKTYFKENLTEIIEMAQQNGVKVIVSNLVSNQRGLKPFASEFSAELDDEQRRRWQGLVDEAGKLIEDGEYAEALQKLNKAKAMDQSPAILHYEMATIYEKMGKFSLAKEEYAHAADLDALRFRASSEFNKIIKEVCLNSGAIFVDMGAFFEKNSPNEIIGNELLTEHVHPNLNGYFLMGKIFTHALYQSRRISPDSVWQWERDLSDYDYLKRSGMTQLDTTIGNLRTKIILRQWPFRKDKVVFMPAIRSPIEKLALQVVYKKISWRDAHYALAQLYQEKGNYKKARDEYLAVFSVESYNTQPLLRAGDISLMARAVVEADSLYKLAIKIEPDSPFGYAKLGLLSYIQNKFTEAIHYFRMALNKDQTQEILNDSDRKDALSYLADSYGQTGNNMAAKEIVEQLLDSYPNDSTLNDLILINKIKLN